MLHKPSSSSFFIMMRRIQLLLLLLLPFVLLYPTTAFQSFGVPQLPLQDVLSSFLPQQAASVSSASLSSKRRESGALMVGENKKNATTLASTHLEPEPEQETIRVRIWRVLVASYGEELSLQQLQKLVGGGGNGVNRQTLRDHLTHVGRQAKTLQNKKTQWKARRGFYDQATAATANDQDTNQPEPPPARRLPRRMDKIRLHLRRGSSSSSSSSSHDGNSGGGTKGGRRSGKKKKRNTTIYVKLE